MKLLPLLTMAVAFLPSTLCHAQATERPNVEIEPDQKPDEKAVKGWTKGGTVGASFNLVDQKKVIGQTEGQTSTLTLKSELFANLLSDKREWDNKLSLNQSRTKTPDIERYINSDDSIEFDSVYRYFFKKGGKLGLYGQATVTSQLFSTYSEQADDVTFTVFDQDADEARTEVTDRFELASSFSPVTAKESAGLVYRPVNEKTFKVEVKAGLGAKQIMAAGTYSIDDDEETDAIEVFESKDVDTMGGLLRLDVNGNNKKKTWTYELYAETLMPFQYSPEGDNDPEGVKLASTDVGLNLSYKALEWLGLGYSVRVVRDPLLQAEAQVTSSALATVSYTFGDEIPKDE